MNKKELKIGDYFYDHEKNDWLEALEVVIEVRNDSYRVMRISRDFINYGMDAIIFIRTYKKDSEEISKFKNQPVLESMKDLLDKFKIVTDNVNLKLKPRKVKKVSSKGV